MSRTSAFSKGIKAGIPIALGYLAVSFTFGVTAVSYGLSVWQSVLISLTNVTSAGQFAGIGIIAASGSYAELILTEFIINLRYSLMSFSLSQKLSRKESPLLRYAVAFGVTDEIFAVSAAEQGYVSAFFNFGAMAVAIPGWVLGTLGGAILGNLLPAFIVSALSVAIYAMFIAIIIPPAKHSRPILLAIIGAMALSCCFRYIPVLAKVSSGFAIIITTVTVASAAAILAPVKEESTDGE